jgi:hypothetical protein
MLPVVVDDVVVTLVVGEGLHGAAARAGEDELLGERELRGLVGEVGILDVAAPEKPPRPVTVHGLEEALEILPRWRRRRAEVKPAAWVLDVHAVEREKVEVPPRAPARGPPFWQSRVMRRRAGAHGAGDTAA